MEPEIAVVVPSHDRAEGLARLLDGLRAQTLDPHRFEVVVVDDGSDPPQRVAPGELAARVIRHDVALGPAAARNRGWRATRAPLVAFVDDDCTPAPGWLEALLRAAADGGSTYVVQGPVRPPPDETQPQTPLTHTIELGGPSRLFVSCNIAFSRTLLEHTGGFDESFKRACGEDVELGARAVAAGAAVLWAENALVFHEVRHVGLGGVLRLTRKWTDSVRVIAMHPELRDLLTARLFWKPTHPLLLLAALGLLTRRPLPACAAVIPYVRHHLRAHGGVLATARWLPAHVAIDACEVGTAVVGSVRHRTIVL